MAKKKILRRKPKKSPTDSADSGTALSTQSGNADSNFSVDHFLSQAQLALSNLNPPLALKLLEKANSVHKNNSNVFLLLGIAEMDNLPNILNIDLLLEAQERAKLYFLQSIELEFSNDSNQPVENFSVLEKSYVKYLYLGQLSEGKDAIGFYERGVEIMKQELEKCADKAEISALKRKISSVLCSMSEIYMTDCCDEVEAESQCSAFLQHALEIDPTNIEVHQTMGSFKISQCDNDGARKALCDALALWMSPDCTVAVNIPEYNSRLALGKMLVEVGELEKALDVLETVVNENDQDPEGWYVAAWASYRMGGGSDGSEDEEMNVDEGNESEMKEKVVAWKQSKECLEVLLQLAEKGEVDDEMLEHAKKMWSEVEEFLKVNGGTEDTEAFNGEESEDDEMSE
ncbi:hypothetical protein HK096_002838 [Nowakowskiella sp. JEL0078]|nr:hypothetical protein HK096_002838 [Nowakowskiella sp. JEL0078]